MATPEIEFDNAAAADLAARLFTVIQGAPAETTLLASMAIAQLSAACVAMERGLSAPQAFTCAFNEASRVLHQASAELETTSPDVS